MSKSTIHDHLLKLKDAGFINMEYHLHAYRLFVDQDGYHRFIFFETFFGQSPTECVFKKEIH